MIRDRAQASILLTSLMLLLGHVSASGSRGTRRTLATGGGFRRGAVAGELCGDAQIRKVATMTDTPPGPNTVDATRLVVPEGLRGARLDQALSQLFPAHSRSRLQRWVAAGRVRVDGHVRRSKDRLRGGETIELSVVAEPAMPAVRPQAIELSVVHEDTDLLVVDKPAGLVVHPGAGNPDGTLQNALVHKVPELVTVPRAGIVHRLDKDTTGLMVVARSLTAHTALVAALQRRAIRREYLAIVTGHIVAGGKVDLPIGRHPTDRTRMAVREGGRPAVTHYRVLARFGHHSLLRLELESGRTHQIRVHMAHIGHPLLGDPVYGGRLRLPASISKDLAEALQGFRRQALHAVRLGLMHPVTGQALVFEAAPPADMAALLVLLEREARAEP